MSILSTHFTITSHCNQNIDPVDAIDLTNEDIFHLEPLDKLQNERFRRGLDFYVSMVQEESHQFVFEGSRFVEAFLRGNKNLKNPLTKRVIENFKIHKSTKDQPKFVPILDKLETKKPINYLPILLSDHGRPDTERGQYYNLLADCHLLGKDCEKNKEKAIHYYLIGAILGYENSKKALTSISRTTDIELYHKVIYIQLVELQSKKSVYLMNKTGSDIKIKSSLFSFYYYHQSALLGNPYGIAKVISYYEKGLGIEKNQHKANLWRTFIPKDWQEEPLEDYLKFLGKNHDLLSTTENLDLPEELLVIEPGIHEPDPDKLFPGVKEQLEKELSGVYTNEKWEKRQKDLAKLMRIRLLPKTSLICADEVCEVSS